MTFDLPEATLDFKDSSTLSIQNRVYRHKKNKSSHHYKIFKKK